jgi:hypothetical protein
MRPGVHPVIRAEQALLGSVLADPSGHAWLLDLVDADDLTRPYHGQVPAAMNRVRGRGAAAGPVAVYEELGKDPNLPSSVSHDGVLLADLMAATPQPGHGPAYAAMVISTGIRRRMTLAASRMRQAAEGRDPRSALRLAQQARDELGRCQARWEALPEPMRRELPLPPGRSGQKEIAERLTAAQDEIRGLRRDVGTGTRRQLAERLGSIARHVAGAAVASGVMREREAQGRPSDPDARTAGVRALRYLTAASSQVAVVRGWLRPGHFAPAEHGELCAVMLGMADADKPIDPVTVSWEAAQRGILIDAADLADGNGPFAVASARAVHRQGVLAQVEHLAREIEASAADPASTPTAILQHATERLGRLDRRPGLRHPRQVPGSARSGGNCVLPFGRSRNTAAPLGRLSRDQRYHAGAAGVATMPPVAPVRVTNGRFPVETTGVVHRSMAQQGTTTPVSCHGRRIRHS